MKFRYFLLFIALIAGLAITNIVTTDTIGKQQTQINQLTERVLLLETALSDKSGIKPEKTK